MAAKRRRGEVGTTCRTCKRKLTQAPPELKEGQCEWERKRWQRVAIRCAYCYAVFCPACARKHFKPTHVAAPGDQVTVAKVTAYAVKVGRDTVTLHAKRDDAASTALTVKWAGRPLRLPLALKTGCGRQLVKG